MYGPPWSLGLRNSPALLQYGSNKTSTPLCPGSNLNDGICDAEWMWETNINCTTSIESNSWGQIKGLYR